MLGKVNPRPGGAFEPLLDAKDDIIGDFVFEDVAVLLAGVAAAMTGVASAAPGS